MKIVWAWNNTTPIIQMGVPKYKGGIYGWKLLEHGEVYCEFCKQTVTAPHSHTRKEIDNFNQYGTITENGD